MSLSIRAPSSDIIRLLSNNVATEMSSTNPAHSLPQSSKSLGQDASSSSGTSPHPTSQPVGGAEQHAAEEREPEAHAGTHDVAGDETTNPRKPSSGQGDGTEAPRFQPFFTLIEDARTAEYHHPTVHYIFSDDDTDIVTEAALRSLEAQQVAHSGVKKDHTQRQDDLDEGGQSALLPPPIPGVRENYLVLDVEPITTTNPPTEPPKTSEGTVEGGGGGGGGVGTNVLSISPAQQPTHPPSGAASSAQRFRITSAKSFSPTWQVLGTELVPAPTSENGNPGDTPGHGLMLKIHGTDGISSETGKEKEKGARKLEDMMDQFAKQMGELQMVIDEAGLEAEAGKVPQEHGDEGNEQKDMAGAGVPGQAKGDGASGKQSLEEHA